MTLSPSGHFLTCWGMMSCALEPRVSGPTLTLLQPLPVAVPLIRHFLLPGSHIYLTHFSQVINEQLLILLFSYQEMQLFSSFIFSFSWPLGAAGGGGAHFPQPKTYQEIFLTQSSPLL